MAVSPEYGVRVLRCKDGPQDGIPMPMPTKDKKKCQVLLRLRVCMFLSWYNNGRDVVVAIQPRLGIHL